MWRDQKRWCGAGTYVSPDLLAPLLDPRVKIVRAKGGKVYEFRHDEMRGYLAAKWLAEQVVSPLSLFEEDVKIWQNGRDEQKVLWGLLPWFPVDGGAPKDGLWAGICKVCCVSDLRLVSG